MKYLTLILLLVVACAGPQGPIGPQGSQGEPGEAGELYSKTGVLYESEKVEGKNWWDISASWMSDTIVVQVWVRKGAGDMWKAANFYYCSWYIRIFDDLVTDSADEYMVVGIPNE